MRFAAFSVPRYDAPMTKPSNPDELGKIETRPDAWERFEHAVDAALHTKPKHRTKGASLKMAKAHSLRHADEFIRLGWTLKREFRASEHDEPYEYLFVWDTGGEPDWPDSDPDKWGSDGKSAVVKDAGKD